MPEVKSKPSSKKGSSHAAAKPLVTTESQAIMSTTVTPEQRYQMIAEAAYFHAERRHFLGGDPAQDWQEAEAEIDRILQYQSKTGRSPKQIFQQKLEAQLRDLDTVFDELKLQSGLAKAELRAEFEKQLEVLAAKRAAAQAKLGELSRRTESAWEDLKGGTEKAWDDMRQTLNQIASRFK